MLYHIVILIYINFEKCLIVKELFRFLPILAQLGPTRGSKFDVSFTY